MSKCTDVTSIADRQFVDGNSCAATSVSNCHHSLFLGSHTSSWPLGAGKPILTARASGYACFNIAMHRLANGSSAASGTTHRKSHNSEPAHATGSPRRRGRNYSKRLRPLEIEECPFANLPEKKAGRWGAGLTAEKMREYRWLKPQLVGQFEFVEWTDVSHLRHTKFIALREDKKAKDVVREK
jgi:hypothetical protein